ncbi:MAG: hypothetical protein LBF25_00635 [Puniceicoccales bacterium]|nr:hypothetical protein [Puniceicoccales bacterium]
MDSINIKGFNDPEMVEIFSNGITRCIAPQDIANRFFTELTDGERTEITDGFEEDQDLIAFAEVPSGKITQALTGMNDRGIGSKYIFNVESKTSGASINFRIVSLEIDDEAWPQ